LDPTHGNELPQTEGVVGVVDDFIELKKEQEL